jgi:hypothetical protein
MAALAILFSGWSMSKKSSPLKPTPSDGKANIAFGKVS